jgi:hypothetical protein
MKFNFLSPTLRRFLAFGIPMLVVWGTMLLAFWPGIMSQDSLDQWSQILRASFTDYHPAFHTLTEWLVSRIGQSPASIAVFQIIFLGAIAACGFQAYSKFGVPGVVIGFACIIFILWPANLFLSITLWKDIPYSAAVLAIAICLLEIIRTRGGWLIRNWWLLGIVSALASLFRHNGIIPGMGTVVLLFFLYFPYRKWIFSSLGILLAIFLFVKYPLYSWAGVSGLNDEERSIFEMADEMHFLAGQVHNGTTFLPAEAALLNSIHPLTDKWNFYDCHMIDKVYKTTVLNWPVAIQNSDAILQMTLATAIRNPKATAKHMACKTELIWNLLPAKYQTLYITPIQAGTSPNYIFIPPDGFSGAKVAQEPVLPALGYSLTQWETQLADSPWQALFFRPALIMYFLFLVVAITILRRREWAYGYVLIPVLLHIAGIILVLPSQQIRYQYPVILIALMVIPLYLYLSFGEAKGNNIISD